jgi:acid phosphatase (class A)
MARPSALASLLFFSLVPSLSIAGWNDLPASHFWLSDPPARGSSQEREELRELHLLEDERSDAQCAQGREQHSHGFKTLFSTQLTSRELRILEPFLDEVLDYADQVAQVFKDRFARARPFSVDRTLRPCISKPSGATSYPSAHATLGAIGGCILAEILPLRAEELTEHGAWVGELRIIGGVHFRSDVEAGQALASQICKKLLFQKDFVRELERLRARL